MRVSNAARGPRDFAAGRQKNKNNNRAFQLAVSLTHCTIRRCCIGVAKALFSPTLLDLFVSLAPDLPARALKFLCITEFDHRAGLLLQSFVTR